MYKKPMNFIQSTTIIVRKYVVIKKYRTNQYKSKVFDPRLF